MGHAQHQLITAHQAALRAERDQLALAAQVHVVGPGIVRAALRTIFARLGGRRAATARTTGSPLGAPLAGPRTGTN